MHHPYIPIFICGAGKIQKGLTNGSTEKGPKNEFCVHPVEPVRAPPQNNTKTGGKDR